MKTSIHEEKRFEHSSLFLKPHDLLISERTSLMYPFSFFDESSTGISRMLLLVFGPTMSIRNLSFSFVELDGYRNGCRIPPIGGLTVLPERFILDLMADLSVLAADWGLSKCRILWSLTWCQNLAANVIVNNFLFTSTSLPESSRIIQSPFSSSSNLPIALPRWSRCGFFCRRCSFRNSSSLLPCFGWLLSC